MTANLKAFAGMTANLKAFAGMTANLKATRLAEMTSFPRKRESISVSESRNLSMYNPKTAFPVRADTP